MGEVALKARRCDRTAEPWLPVAPVMRMGLGVGVAILGVWISSERRGDRKEGNGEQI